MANKSTVNFSITTLLVGGFSPKVGNSRFLKLGFTDTNAWHHSHKVILRHETLMTRQVKETSKGKDGEK